MTLPDPTAIPGEPEPFENTLSLEEAREELRRAIDLQNALRRALIKLPEVPDRNVLMFLAAAAKGPNDHAIGVAMQREFGFEAIPLKHEYERGAGLWARIRKGLAAGAVVLALGLPTPAPAQSSDCAMIADQGKRALCRAMTSGRESNCSIIRDGDDRAACRGVTTGRSSNCSLIRNADERALCRAQTR